MRVSGIEVSGPPEVCRITLPGMRTSRPGIFGVVPTIGLTVGTGITVAFLVSRSGIQIVKGRTVVWPSSMST